MKKIIDKHYNKIIIALFFILIFSKISSCSDNRSYKKEIKQIENELFVNDSIIVDKNNEILKLNDSIKVLSKDNEYLNMMLNNSKEESAKNRETLNALARKNVNVTNKIEK